MFVCNCEGIYVDAIFSYKIAVRVRNFLLALKGLSHEIKGGYCSLSIESSFQGLLPIIIKF